MHNTFELLIVKLCKYCVNIKLVNFSSIEFCNIQLELIWWLLDRLTLLAEEAFLTATQQYPLWALHVWIEQWGQVFGKYVILRSDT